MGTNLEVKWVFCKDERSSEDFPIKEGYKAREVPRGWSFSLKNGGKECLMG